jgi:hypothetical protein
VIDATGWVIQCNNCSKRTNIHHPQDQSYYSA